MDVDDVGYFEPRRIRSTRMSQNQFGVMVDFLTLHPELISSSNSSTKQPRQDLRKKWEELAAVLNSDSTGSQKTVDKWKKSWQDHKVMLKNKVKMLFSADLPSNSSQLNETLSELEEKAWKLITSQRSHSQKGRSSQNNDSETTDAVASISPQSVGYVVLNVNGTPLNVLPAQMPDGTTSDSVEQSNNMKQSGILAEGTIKLEPDTFVSESSADFPVVKEVYSCQNDASSSNQPSSGQKKSFGKTSLNIKLKTLRTLRRKKEEYRIVQLLQRQNMLLERLVGSVSRIEKSLLANNSQHARKESAIRNIVTNIDKIAGSLGSVSKSLKTVSEK